MTVQRTSIEYKAIKCLRTNFKYKKYIFDGYNKIIYVFHCELLNDIEQFKKGLKCKEAQISWLSGLIFYTFFI